MNLNEHWDNIFENTNDEKLGWYEYDVNQTLKFLNFVDDFKDLTINLPVSSELIKKSCLILLILFICVFPFFYMF